MISLPLVHPTMLVQTNDEEIIILPSSTYPQPPLNVIIGLWYFLVILQS